MIRYFIYVRKSQDRSDRQVMSIEGQINEIKRFAKQQGYIIADILIEKKSAKKPGRPIFNEMIERLQNGEANGILCWKLNRVARNPIDAGTISWLLQGNVIQAIHSKERSYLPTDNVLMMQIDFGIANQFIKDLSSDVKRGMRDKANSGWCPRSIPTVGYIHHPKKQQANEQIIPDPDRFPIIRELWKRMETGAYSIADIKKQAEQLGLLNRNGKQYEIKTFRRIFSNPMYYGKFYWKDENGILVLWDGKHEPMVSEITFRKVQQIISNRSKKTRPRSHVYTYRGLITCGECNGHVTAERKLQVICTNCKHKYSILTNEICRKCNLAYSKMTSPSVINKIYYRCLRYTDPSCRQKSISEKQIEQQITNALEQVSIPCEIYNWTLEHLDQKIESIHKTDETLVDSLRRQRDKIKNKRKNLIDLQVSGEISSEEAKSLKNEYQKDIDTIDSQLFEKENALAIAKHDSHKHLEFAKNCINRFKNGDQNKKKELTAYFISNLTLFEKSLYFSTKKTPSVLSSVQNLFLANLGISNLE